MAQNRLPSFLPASAKQLTVSASTTLLHQISRVPVNLPESRNPIATAYVHTGSSSDDQPPLLLLHGFDSSLLEFRFLLPLLAGQREVWLVDLLGCGFTEFLSDVAIAPATMKTHLHSFWQQQIHRPVILIGASMGGAAAIDFTLTYPELVARLVLIDSVGYTGPPWFVQYLPSPLNYWAVEYLRQRKLQALELCQWLQADPHWLDLLRCSLLHTEMPGWHHAMMSFTQSGGYSFLADRIAQINQPTLILWGEGDDVLGTADAERFHRDIDHSQLVWIRHSKHNPQIEQPQATATQIHQFCEVGWTQ